MMMLFFDGSRREELNRLVIIRVVVVRCGYSLWRGVIARLFCDGCAEKVHTVKPRFTYSSICVLLIYILL
jgi:hypothetical protein